MGFQFKSKMYYEVKSRDLIWTLELTSEQIFDPFLWYAFVFTISKAMFKNFVADNHLLKLLFSNKYVIYAILHKLNLGCIKKKLIRKYQQKSD